MTTYKLCERRLTTATCCSALTKKPPAMRLHAAAILVIFWLGVFTVRTAKGSIGSQAMRKFKCVDLSAQKWNIQSLVSYERQQVPVNAIIFLHSKGFKICVSPEQKWVQAAMKKIDQKRNTKGK